MTRTGASLDSFGQAAASFGSIVLSRQPYSVICCNATLFGACGIFCLGYAVVNALRPRKVSAGL